MPRTPSTRYPRAPDSRRRDETAGLRGPAQPGARPAARTASHGHAPARESPGPDGGRQRVCAARGPSGSGSPQGRVWAVHTAWSGNHAHYAERCPRASSVLGGGELLLPGEIVLASGETYRAPGSTARSATGWTRSRAASTATCARPRPVRAAERPVDAQRVGGRLLRPRPRPAASTSPIRPPRSASSASCSTTAGSEPAATTAPGSATGSSRPTCGRTGCTRSSTTCAGWACSSGCGSSPRWSTSTPTSPARTRSGSWRRGRRAAGRVAAQQVLDLAHAGRVRARAGADAGAARRVRHRLHQVGPQPRPHRSRRPQTDGGARRARADAGVLPAARRAPCGAPGAGDRVVLVGRRPGRPRRCSSGPTGSGCRTTSTRTTGSG